MCNKYNGWSNYQTWNVALWLQNDEYYMDEIDNLISELENNPDNKNNIIYNLSERIKSDLEEAYTELTENNGMMNDLLGYSVRLVNYYEIAENLLDL